MTLRGHEVPVFTFQFPALNVVPLPSQVAEQYPYKFQMLRLAAASNRIVRLALVKTGSEEIPASIEAKRDGENANFIGGLIQAEHWETWGRLRPHWEDEQSAFVVASLAERFWPDDNVWLDVLIEDYSRESGQKKNR